MPTRDDLVAGLAETKVEKLSREGYQSLVEFLKRHLGPDVFAETEQERHLGFLVDVRNLHVHHRGRVHHRFAGIWEEERRLNELYPIDWPFLITAMRELCDVATAIDAVAVEKYSVRPLDAERLQQET